MDILNTPPPFDKANVRTDPKAVMDNFPGTKKRLELVLGCVGAKILGSCLTTFVCKEKRPSPLQVEVPEKGEDPLLSLRVVWDHVDQVEDPTTSKAHWQVPSSNDNP